MSLEQSKLSTKPDIRGKRFNLSTDQVQESFSQRLERWWDDSPKTVFLLPTVLMILFLSVFPLMVSLYLSFSRVQFVKGGFDVTFIRWQNYKKLLAGSEERHFLGKMTEPSDTWKAIFVLLTAFAIYYVVFLFIKTLKRNPFNLVFQGVTLLYTAALVWVIPTTLTNQLLPGTEAIRDIMGRYGEPPLLWRTIFWLSIGLVVYYAVTQRLNRAPINVFGFAFRLAAVAFASSLLWLTLITLNDEGLPGTLIVTLVFVFAGITVQYLLGLGLALLLTQNLPGRRFFRVIYLLPMMITPVGIGFLFRMMTDTGKGPFAPVWEAVGLQDFAWVTSPTASRVAVIIGDTWQWTPFVFIILLAALEGVSQDTVEAALVDGANRSQLFRHIVLPQVIPVSTTVLLIRLIESFKILDMPQIMTNGAPGTATESVTLQAYNAWRALDWGGAAALAYLLLIVSTFAAVFFVNIVRRDLLERV
jgi:multiple sugar transport system permease protein